MGEQRPVGEENQAERIFGAQRLDEAARGFLDLLRRLLHAATRVERKDNGNWGDGLLKHIQLLLGAVLEHLQVAGSHLEELAIRVCHRELE